MSILGYRSERFNPVSNLLPIVLMKRIALLLVLILGLAAASAARSQQPVHEPVAKSKRPAPDTVDFTPSPELQKSLEELAAAVQALALRIANDPQIKTAAMQVASGAVTTAQQVVSEQSVHIQEALKTAAERISAAQASQHQKVKKP